MNIKIIKMNNLNNIDIKTFYFLKSFLFKNRIKVYLFIFLLLFIKIMLKIPYLNVFIDLHKDIINVTVVSLLVAAILEFNGQKLIIISVILFLPLAFITLVGQNTISEQLANVIYGLLSIGTLILIVRYIQGKDA